MRRRYLLAAGVVVAVVATILGSSSYDLHLPSTRVRGAAPQGGTHAETLFANQAALALEAEVQIRIQPLASERDRMLGVAKINPLGLTWTPILLLAPRRPKLASRVAEAPSRSPPFASTRVISVF